MMRKIQYLPLKESEIKEILRLIKSYSISDIDTINATISKHNCNEVKSNNIKKALEECVQKKSEKIFDVRFGLCIARVQMMYRGNFYIDDLSITGLVRKFPFFHRYSKKWNEMLKQNKYEYKNSLGEMPSSGMYIPFENIEKLYNDYYFDVKVKEAIDTYFGNSVDKFINILDYCLKEKCGVLEAISNNSVNINANNSNNPSKATININNSNSTININNNSTKNKTNEIKAGTIIGSIIGCYIAFAFVNAIIFELLENNIIMKMNHISAGLIVWTILQIITHFFFWKLTLKLLLKNKTINRNSKKKVNVFIALFLTGYLLFSGFFTSIAVSNRIKNTIKDYELQNYYYESASKLANKYKSDSIKEEENKYEQEKQAYTKNVETKYAAYYGTYLVVITSVNYIMLIYLNKKLKAKITSESNN